jgi:hypothetical protein
MAEPPGRAAGRARTEGLGITLDSRETLRAGVVVVLVQVVRPEIKKVAVRVRRGGL